MIKFFILTFWVSVFFNATAVVGKVKKHEKNLLKKREVDLFL